MEKWQDNRAWFLVLPAFIIVAFSGIIPLMTVVNYSLQDIFGPGQAVFVGTEWFKEMLANHRLHDALWRQFLFSGLVLLIEIPLGIMIALAMPTRGWGVSACLVTLALPLVIPWNVIGTIWIIFTRPDIGLFGVGINSLDLLEDLALRGAQLTRQLLLFSRREAMQSKRLDLNEVVRSTSRLLERLVKENISLRIELADDALEPEHAPQRRLVAGQRAEAVVHLGQAVAERAREALVQEQERDDVAVHHPAADLLPGSRPPTPRRSRGSG